MRKERMKKVYVPAVLILCAVFLLSGCAGKDSGDTVNLRWVTYQAGDVPLDVKEVVAAANAVSKEKIGITVSLEFQPKEKLNLIMASGEYYDMIFTSSWINNYDRNASAGLYYDITDLVKEETPLLYSSVDPYWECAKVNGKIFAVPVLKDMGAEDMFRLNADYFEKEKGMKIPETMELEDIEPFLKAYKEDYPDKYPLDMTRSGAAGYANFLERVVDPLIVLPFGEGDDISNVVPFYECEQLIDRFRLFHKWYKAGYINPDAATIESSINDKSIPVRFGVAWKGYQGYSDPNDWGFEVKTSIYDGPFLSRSSEQGAMFAICAACSKERAEACLKYLEFLSTDREFRDILAYGIEGKHFEYLKNGTVLRTQTGRDRYNTKLYQTGSDVIASVESVSRTFMADPDQWKKVYEEYRTDGIYSKTGGFAYDTTGSEDVISALQAVYSVYASELITGTSDPDEVIPEIRKRMEAAGMDELLADVRNQLKEWKRSNEK